MTAMLHYVCDSCGNYWRAYRLPDDGDGCPACRSPRLWEFEADQGTNARHHAAHVARVKSSGIFRRGVRA